MSAPNNVQSNNIATALLPSGSYYSDQYVQAAITLVPNTGTDAPIMTMQFHKFGSKISLRIIGGVNTASGAGVATYTAPAFSIPAAFRPTVVAQMVYPSTQAGVKTLTHVEIAANGSMVITPVGAATFVASSYITAGVQDYFLD